MTDIWDNNGMEQPSDATIPAEESVNTDDTAADSSAPAESAEPTAPVTNVAPDGTYRYVPPRAPQQPPYQPPYPGGAYPPPQGGYQPPYQGYYTPPTPPAPPAPPASPKKNTGWMTVVAILCALAVVLFAVWGAFLWIDSADTDNPPTDSTTNTNPDDNTPTVNDNAPELNIQGSGDNLQGNNPSLEVGNGDDFYAYDGGLSTEEIVSRNYNSTVVLSMYSMNNNYYFGESGLTEVGAASGIVMTADGYVITNRHCVIDESTGKKYDRVDVTTYDGTVYEDATVIGVDEATDLAVIKVDATNLTPAEFGNSDELSVGSRVVALGNAAGLAWTATQGIVSAKARDVYEDTGYAIKCLQTDAPINSGNSGGPLLNKYGQVVAINSAKIAATGYDGLGFAIPINEAKVIIDSLLKYGYVQGRVALGITGQTISSGIYRGFMIKTIEQGSCLEGTEAKAGDLIVAVDDVQVVDYGTLRAEMARHKVGDRVTLKLLRSDMRTGNVTTHYVTVTLKEQTAQ